MFVHPTVRRAIRRTALRVPRLHRPGRRQPRGAEFRELLDEREYVFATGIYHALDARLAEMAGLDAASMSGYPTGFGQFGFPDLETVTTRTARGPASPRRLGGALRVLHRVTLPLGAPFLGLGTLS